MGQMTAENTAKDHTNTGLIIMCRIFSDIITISFSLHLKWTFTCTEKFQPKQLTTKVAY